MKFLKEIWNESDIIELHEYLNTLDKVNSKERELRILNTSFSYIGVRNEPLKKISKEILNSNYKSFLNVNKPIYHEDFMINGNIINKIKDFNEFVGYLDKYLEYADSWAHTDIIKFNIKNNEENYFNLAKKYLKSDKTYVRRMGVRILFNYCNNSYTDKVFELIENLYDETEYYVNMCISWLLCDLMIKSRDKTIKYMDNHHLNKFVVNKMISKCRDSYRVSSEDKELLTKYRM